ncbi:retrovirus-related pol polyprotein from transposon TNT 1-94 [Tanacetum coccineum]
MKVFILVLADFSKGSVDPTLFIRRDGKELLLVQIYVDDIIFAASTPELCDLFSKIMCSKFKMSMMGKISFFLGLQISQSPRGIFINQSKYALESLKKYDFDSCDPVDTPMVEKSKLDEDKEGKAVDPSHYRGMIGTLLYLTASRPDLQFAICMCARYQARPTEKHLNTEHVENGVIELYFVNTKYQLAYIFTKALGRNRIEFLINKLGMRSFTPKTLKQLTDEVDKKDQIDNLLKERRLMRSLEKFVGGKLYEGDLRLRQKNHMILSYDVLINQVRIKKKSQENGQKPDKHGHGNGRAHKEPRECYQVNPQSTLGQSRSSWIRRKLKDGGVPDTVRLS